MKIYTVKHPTINNLFLSAVNQWAPLRFAQVFLKTDTDSMAPLPQGGRWSDKIDITQVLQSKQNIMGLTITNLIGE